jgi:hypothetical protein
MMMVMSAEAASLLTQQQLQQNKPAPQQLI